MTLVSTSFEGQTVFITGAAQGIGAATARLIAQRGGRVFAMDIAVDALRELQRDLDLPDEQIVYIDLGDQESVVQAIKSSYAVAGRVDALINSAGVVGPSGIKVEEINWSDFERTLRINHDSIRSNLFADSLYETDHPRF